MNIQNSPYADFCCARAHTLEWTGNKHTFDSKTCKKCNLNYSIDKQSAVRWTCSECKDYYCQKCIFLLKYKYCPDNHEIQFYKNYPSSSFTCDMCYKIFYNYIDVWLDKKCNIGFCTDCVGEHEILTEEVVFED